MDVSSSLRVLQLLHDEAVDHVRHVGGDFAGREAELAVEQFVDVAQRVGESVSQLSPRGCPVRLIGQFFLKTLVLLWLTECKRSAGTDE